MKAIIKDDVLGEISYNESSLTGKKTVLINGKQLTKVDRTTYSLTTEEGTKNYCIQGNFIMGVKLIADGRQIQLTPAIKWYEYLLVVISFAFLIAWSNIPKAVMILPIVGGAIGGFIYALLSMTCLFFMKGTSKIWAKILIWLGFTGLMVLCGYAIAVLVISAMY